MRQRTSAVFLALVATIALSFLGAPPLQANAKEQDGWKPLFNGKDLDGWDTWLGQAFPGFSADRLKKLTQYADLDADAKKDLTLKLDGIVKALNKPIGLNRDPAKVYTVVPADGKPAIRISGEIFGAITTKAEFENYHLSLEFKWGKKKWPPRENDVRDSGLLYHCVGPHGAAGTFWMKSQELQIQEKDCGDYWSVAGGIVDVEGDLAPGKGLVYKKGGEKFAVPGPKYKSSRIVKSPDNEKPSGEWNVIELLTVGPTSVHVVNGKVVMVLTNSRHLVDGKETPLTRGKIQLQSEGAEVFYRNVRVKALEKIPASYLD